MTIKNVGVVGGGLMGSGIAQTVAQAGYDVLLAEVSQELLDRGMARVNGAWDMLTKKGKITADQATEYRGRINGTLDMKRFADRDLVIEAIIENMDEKKKLFSTLDGIVPAGAIIASNTSSLPIIEMASVTKRQENIAGLHFFNPAPVMKLVEMVRTHRHQRRDNRVAARASRSRWARRRSSPRIPRASSSTSCSSPICSRRCGCMKMVLPPWKTSTRA